MRATERQSKQRRYNISGFDCTHAVGNGQRRKSVQQVWMDVEKKQLANGN